jgi:hypothetical protein
MILKGKFVDVIVDEDFSIAEIVSERHHHTLSIMRKKQI